MAMCCRAGLCCLCPAVRWSVLVPLRCAKPWPRLLSLLSLLCSVLPPAAALGQVVALLLRSSGRPGQPVPAPEAELDYPALLNRVGALIVLSLQCYSHALQHAWCTLSVNFT